MDYDTIGSDDLIGSTTIVRSVLRLAFTTAAPSRHGVCCTHASSAAGQDLEDRVFNIEWQRLEVKPLEWRPLYTPYSKNPQWQVQLCMPTWARTPD